MHVGQVPQLLAGLLWAHWGIVQQGVDEAVLQLQLWDCRQPAEAQHRKGEGVSYEDCAGLQESRMQGGLQAVTCSDW